MTPLQVNQLFQSYTDESDRTFLTEVQIGLYLSQAYTELRQIVCNIDPYIYSIEHLFTLGNTNVYDLAANPPQLLGLGATAGTKLERLLRVARINDTTQNDVLQWLNAAPSEQNMPLWGYTFVKSKLIFSGTSNASFRLEYVPFHDVVFENGGAISPYIDDLDGFHELIALMAYSRYAIRDGADNIQLLQALKTKRQELDDYLQHGRNRPGSEYVLDQARNGNY
tara:strand:+ start:11500 stop:12171 length:672 start_codon:yes stop_codon:yes gene_type:complete